MEINLFNELCNEFWAPGFEISVVENYDDNSNTPARSHHNKKLIEVKIDIVTSGSTAGLYLLIRWCVRSYYLKPVIEDGFIKTDNACLYDCINEGYNRLEIFNCFIKYLSVKSDPFNTRRIDNCYTALKLSFLQRLSIKSKLIFKIIKSK
jgi:hypothetical protein